jgi:hypothetical protein
MVDDVVDTLKWLNHIFPCYCQKEVLAGRNSHLRVFEQKMCGAKMRPSCKVV